MIVDQVSELIDHIPDEELLSVAKTASVQPSQSKHVKNHMKAANEDHEMVQANSNKKKISSDAYMTNSRMMRDQLILPQPAEKPVNSHNRYLKAQRERQQNWIDQKNAS
jgi:hypothetical protein